MNRITFEDAETVLDIVNGPNNGGWYLAYCPAHDDSTPSLAIKEAGSGNLIPKCFAGCSAREIYDSIRDLLDE